MSSIFSSRRTLDKEKMELVKAYNMLYTKPKVYYEHLNRIHKKILWGKIVRIAGIILFMVIMAYILSVTDICYYIKTI